jgi:putative flavoprotein involved in K+ transport
MATEHNAVQTSDVLVIGAGPAGLAAAKELTRIGKTVVVVDSASEVGSSWSRHYDRLHLHTARNFSRLPGKRMPSSYGQWVARDDFRQYLKDYSDGLDVRLGVTASAVKENNGRWAVSTDHGDFDVATVVVATGYNHAAKIPDWPGLKSFTGKVVHSSEYRNSTDLGAKNVLIVGPGNSGSEIAADLAGAGVGVTLSVRTPPNIVLRSVLGIPMQALVLMTVPLPTKLGDVIGRALQAVTVGNLSRYGLAKAPRGVFTQMERDDVTPTIDVGMIAALKAGKVAIVPAVESFTKDSVVLADGSSVKPDTVLVATGFQRGLEKLVGHLDILSETGRPLINADVQLIGLEGLYFLGYSNPIEGNIRQVGLDATKIAKRVAKQSTATAR